MIIYAVDGSGPMWVTDTGGQCWVDTGGQCRVILVANAGDWCWWRCDTGDRPNLKSRVVE